MPVVVEVRIDVARSPEEVFQFVADGYFENVRRWDRDLVEITPLGDGVMALGTRAVEVRREPLPRRGKKPVGRTVEVAVFDRPHELALTGLDSHPGHDLYSTRWRFAELGRRTRVWLRYQVGLPFPFVLGTPVVAMRNYFDLKRRLRRLREEMEG
jgi:Polyketide cyclase / dehydrase and lipid transport